MDSHCLYYTDGVISDDSTLTKLCLLFDKVSSFYLSPQYFLEPLERRWESEKEMPFFAKSPCEKSLITSEHLMTFKTFSESNKLLIDSGVLMPIVVNQTPPDWEGFEENEKKLMRDGSGISFGQWGQSVGIVPAEKIFVDSPWFSLYRWQSIAGGLHFALQTGMVPISDNRSLSGLAIDTVTRFGPSKPLPTPDEIAAQVAFQSMSLLVPDFPSLNNEEILEVRERLREEFTLFRAEMEGLVRSIDKESYKDIESVILLRIKPRLDDMKLKIKSLKGELFRRIAGVFFVGGAATTLMSHFITMPLSAQIAAAASLAGKVLIDIHENLSKREELEKTSGNKGLVLLLKLEKLKS
jgi:hypothetical protein